MSFSTAIFIFLSTWLLIIFLLLLGYVITSTNDLQPSIVIANQLLGKSV